MASIDGLVSTIIPVHNRAAMAREAVESVCAQSYRPIEILLVDDGSDQQQAAQLARIANAHPEIALLRRENGGPGAARETGRAAARGEFLQYLDSDDLLAPEKFALQVSALRVDPTSGVAYGMTRFRRADGRCVEGAWKGGRTSVGEMFPSFLVSRWWDTPNPLYRRSLCDAAGPWMQLRIEEDWEYDCRIASLGVRLAYVPHYVCEVRDHSGERLSRNAGDAAILAQRASAHARIFEHGRRAGIGVEAPEMRHFARALFLLARQCGAAGLEDESARLFALSRRASGEARAKGLDFRLFAAAARILGWTHTSRLAALLDRLRP